MNTYRNRRIRQGFRRLMGLQPRYAQICLNPSNPTTVYDGTIAGNVYVQEQTANGMGTPTSVRGPAGNSVVLALGTWVELQSTSDNRLAIVNYNVPGNASAGVNVLATNTPQLQSGGFVGQQSIITALLSPQLTPDLTVAIKSWAVVANSLYYEFPGTPSGGFDLAGAVPSAGNNRITIVFIKSDYTTVFSANSTPRSTADLPLNATDIQEALTAGYGTDAAATPIAALRMYGGQTTIIQSDIVQDIRQMINNTQASGVGSVTSVGLVLPSSTFTITVSPITSSGSLTAIFANQSANQIFAGPATGAAAVPTWRSLVAADLPAGTVSPLTTKGDLYTFSTVNARLGIGANNTVLVADSAQTTGNKWSASLSGLTLVTPTIASFVNATHDHTNAAGGGQITDAALSSQVTVAKGGTGLVTLTAHAALIGNGTGNVLFLAPSTSRNVMISDGTDWTSRALVAADIPSGAGSPLTTKGDLYTFSTVNARLAVGANNTILVADSAQTTGNKWTATLTGLTLDNGNTVTLKDTLFTLQDDGDTTKQLRFQLSGITTATTRTLTAPDASGTIALTSATGQGYIMTAPTVTADNVITVTTASIRALALKTSDNSTSVNLFEILKSDNTVLASVGATGLAVFAGIDNTPIGATTKSTGAFTTLTAAATTITGTSDTFQLTIVGFSTQTNVLQRWRNSTPTTVASISNLGHGAFGTSSAPPTTTILQATKTFPDPAATILAMDGHATVTLTATNAQTIEGLRGFVTITQTGFDYTGIATGLIGLGLANGADHTAANIIGGLFQALNQGAGTVTNLIGFQLSSNTNSGGGAVTNNYGILIGDQTVGGTLNYAIKTGLGIVGLGDQLQLAASTTSLASMRIATGTAPTSPVEGDFWNDSTQKSLIGFVDGIKQSYVACLFSASASATVANSTSETSIIGTGVGTKTLPASWAVVGKTIRIRAWGLYSTTLTPTLRWRVFIGSVAVADTTSKTTASTVTNVPWYLECDITVRAVGASGTVFAQGIVTHNTGTVWTMSNSAVSSAIDFTATEAVDVKTTWNTGLAANTITGTNVTIEVMN